MKQVTALLPMKANSERIPGKNTRKIAGRMLFQWVMSSLLDSSCIGRIVVNTDSEVIRQEISNTDGRVIIHDRPEELCGDDVSMNAIIAYDIGVLGEGHYLQTHATNPLLSAATADRAISMYFDALPTHDSLFGVTRLQTRLYDAAGKPVNHDPTTLLRTQDLPPLYEENSTLYLFSAESFHAAGHNRIGRNAVMFEVDRAEAVDIDEEPDWLLAEALLEMRQRGALR